MKNHFKSLTFIIFLLCNFAILPACSSHNNGQQQSVSNNTGNRSRRSLEEISSYGTTYYIDVVQEKMLPRGSALITQSGNLAAQGIERIIHAASGSAGNVTEHFIPTLEGVSLSVNNSLRLARTHKMNRVAIPFIGRGIFLTRSGATPQQLGETIILSALENRGNIGACFSKHSAS